MVAVRYADGVAMVAENSSATLRKISEIYDRIAFAGVGRYNEFDQLRVAGVRAADLKGYQYSRDDVDARSLANQYAQILGQIFTHEMKPMEVEILVAEVGHTPEGDQMFHINYDGTVFDERDYAVLGGDSATISTRFTEAAGDRLGDGFDLGGAVRAAVTALAGPDRTLGPDDLEVALLVRGESRRCFQRTHRRGGRRAARRGGRGGAGAGRAHLRRAVAVDLNSDVGESYGVWRIGDDAAMLRVVSSANVACGFHGGDPSTLRATCAARGGPRRDDRCPGVVSRPRRLRAAVHRHRPPATSATPCSTSSARSTPSPRSPAREVDYVKPHGALYHATIDNDAQAEAVVAAAAEYDPSLAILGQPDSELLAAAERAGLEAVSEALRRPGLPPRRPARAAIGAGRRDHRRRRAVGQAVRIAVDGEVVAVDGEVISLHARSLCVHGDTPGAVALATARCEALEAAGVGVYPFCG